MSTKPPITSPSPASSPPPPAVNASSPSSNATLPPPAPPVSSPPPPVALSPSSPPAPAVVTPSASPPPPAALSPSKSPTPPAAPSPSTGASGSPPPSADASSPPSPPSTISRSPPPPAKSLTTPPPPTRLSHPPPKTPSRRPPPPPVSNSSSSSGMPDGLIAGIVVAGILAFLVLSFLLFCCRKKRRHHYPSDYYGYPGPSPPKDYYYGSEYVHWQQNVSSSTDYATKMNPSLPPPPNASRPSYPPKNSPPMQSLNISGGGSASSYSQSETLRPPPSPSVVLGSSKSTFTLEQLSLATDGFSDANLLGQGGFGYVHKGLLLDGREVAVKSLKSDSGQGEREFQAEVEIISRVHHKHLVSLVGYCIARGQRMLVYEFVPNNTLEFHLYEKDRPTLDWPTRLKIALGSAKGLAYLHEDCHPKIIHRDIKASNILLDFKFEAKVADFGLAKITSDNNTHVSTRVMGTFGYLAPEYASSGKLTDKSDVFSFGVMLLELITGRRPVDKTRNIADDCLVDWARPLLTRALEDGNYDQFIDPRLQKNYIYNEMTRMIVCAAACVRYTARARPQMSQVVRVLEGDVSLEALNEGITPGDIGLTRYGEEMRKFRQMALASSQEYGSSEYSHSGNGTTRVWSR